MTTAVYVPPALDAEEMSATVTACPVTEGRAIAAGDVIVSLQSARVEAEVESPVSGKLVKLYVKPGADVHVGELLAEVAESVAAGESSRDKMRPPEKASPRIATSTELAEHTPAILTVALAAGGIVWPLAWVLAVLVVYAVASAIPSVSVSVRRKPAAIILLPARVLLAIGVRTLTGVIRVVPLIRAVLLVVALAALATALSSLVAIIWWLIAHGSDGLLPASRLGGIAFAPRALSALLSGWLVHRALRTTGVAAGLRDMALEIPELILGIATAAAVGWVALCIFAIPAGRVWWPSNGLTSVVHGMPAALRRAVDHLQLSLVRAEAGSVVSCLDPAHHNWRLPAVRTTEDDIVDVTVRAARPRRVSDASLGALILAIDNELAPRGAHISIVIHRRAQVIRFMTPALKTPLTQVANAVALVPSTRATARILARAVGTSEASSSPGLACSAAAL